MIQKRENCLYCGGKMESVTAKKKFCSDKCKVYWNRYEKLKEAVKVEAENRSNPLINAARGRDENGINEDELVLAEETSAQRIKRMVEEQRKKIQNNKK